MFIATSIKKSVQAPEERNETSRLLRSSGALELNKPGVYKHFIPTGCVHETFLEKQLSRLVTEDTRRHREENRLALDGSFMTSTGMALA